MDVHAGKQLIDPELLLQKAQLQPGMRMADFGCGRTGHIVFPTARLLGERGLVYAVDILPEVLETIAKRSDMEHCSNVHTVWSDIEQVGRTAIPENSIDCIFLVNVLCGIKKRDDVLREARRLLKDKGRLLIVDWAAHRLSFSPPVTDLVSFADIAARARTMGFVSQEEFSAGAYHNGLILYKHD